MKNILIYINDSLGELDWIAPFIKSEEAQGFNFYIFLNAPGKSNQEKLDILKRYGLNKKNIYSINSQSKKDYYIFKFDEFLNRLLGRIKLYSFRAFKAFRTFFDQIRFLSSYLLPSPSVKFDYIFRDYNLKESFVLQQYIRLNKEAKSIVFPHAVGLQKIHPFCPREALKIVKCDLWLENSKLSDIAKNTDAYKDVFFASGVPAFDINYKLKSLFDVEVKKVLIITRDCGMTFGFNYEEAYVVFDSLLNHLEKMGYRIEIKHHPRDRKLKEWRSIQKKYQNIKEVDGSLGDINKTLSACFTLFSTAPLFLLSRRVPIFEFSPYQKYNLYKNKLPMHYSDDDGLLTHDLLSLKLYKKLDNFNKITEYMSKENLENLSLSQYKQCQEIFPTGANLNIVNKLLGLTNDR